MAVLLGAINIDKFKEGKVYKFYHSTINPIIGNWSIKSKNFYGIYFSPILSYSRKYGQLTYDVKVKPNKTLIVEGKEFNDKSLSKINIFNITKPMYDEMIEKGYDSIAWFRGGKLLEFIVLDVNIIKSREHHY
jgi:hypothetical protein